MTPRLAGDNDPNLGCNGPDWRDANGDGESGFDATGSTRTRDELQSRIDLVNLARADLLISIHITSLVDNGVVIEAAATQTYYTDEVAWGPSIAYNLAHRVQRGVFAALGECGLPTRQIERSRRPYYIIAPPLFETTAERPMSASSRPAAS
jgi:hypothetical protein